MNNSVILAVYGTLKREYSNHSVMQLAKGKFISEATSKEKIAMWCSNGVYPYAQIHTSGKNIKVELFEVPLSHLHIVDRLEGYPNHYDRVKTIFTTSEGVDYEAWIYVVHSEQIPTILLEEF